MKGGQDKPSVRGCNADNPSPRLEVVVREYAKGRSVCVCTPWNHRDPVGFFDFYFNSKGSGAGLQSSTEKSSLQCPEDITGDIQ